MISFLTLILGIAVGIRPVEMDAAPGVTSVELRLDGRLVDVLTTPPWKREVDFGAPIPHELVAIARDAEGAETGRAVQRINFPRSLAEATLALLPGKGGRDRFARLVWASALSEKPERVEVTMDGQPILAPDPSRIALPRFRSADIHVLRAVLDFRAGTRATAELLVGGVKRGAEKLPESMRGETEAELTAVPAVFKGGPPKESDMEGWFLADGKALHVEAVEESPGEIVVVKDERAGLWIGTLEASHFYTPRNPFPLRKGQRLRFCWPGILPAGDAAPGYDVFMRSPDYTGNRNVRQLLVEVEPPEHGGPTRLGDAAAVAALSAAAGNRPRAVVLLVGGPDDESRLPLEWVRGYLRALRVPLFVWAKNKKIAAAWGRVEVLDTLNDLENAVSRLTKSVESQRIVWLEGRYLPQSISLSPKARKVALIE